MVRDDSEEGKANKLRQLNIARGYRMDYEQRTGGHSHDAIAARRRTSSRCQRLGRSVLVYVGAAAFLFIAFLIGIGSHSSANADTRFFASVDRFAFVRRLKAAVAKRSGDDTRSSKPVRHAQLLPSRAKRPFDGG